MIRDTLLVFGLWALVCSASWYASDKVVSEFPYANI